MIDGAESWWRAQSLQGVLTMAKKASVPGKLCIDCGKTRPLEEFYRRSEGSIDGHRSKCKQCYNSGRYPVQRLLTAIKSRAKKSGILFSLTPSNIKIPDRCPVLNMPLRWGWQHGGRGYRDDSPSIDRLDPELGYVPGNVVVVSHRANRLRSDAAVWELEAILEFYREALDGRDSVPFVDQRPVDRHPQTDLPQV